MHCRTCSSNRLEQFLDLGDQPHCDSLLRPEDLARQEPYYPLKVWFCHDCTTVQIDYTVPKEEMFGEYLYVSGTTQTLRDHFQSSTDRLVSRLGLQPGDLVVDIGSNDGTWLACFAKQGMRVLGVDGARNLAEIANSRGIETMNRFFNAAVAEEIIESKGFPKLVTAAGVFFHLEELHSVTKGIAYLCAKGAVFCVQAIYLGAILAHTQFDQIYHEHLTYWTVSSLDQLFAQHGLEILRADPLSIHGGSLELLVAAKGTRKAETSVETFRKREKAEGYHQIETYRAFAKRVWKIRDELLPILTRQAEQRKSVYAMGAPAKGATLLNSFGITTDLVTCATEVNPLKVGKYIPGARIPIVAEADVSPPDAYLILPWNFLAEFLRKQVPYLRSGGEFIVPIPAPTIIDSNSPEFRRIA